MRRRQFCAAVAAGGFGGLTAGCLSVGSRRSEGSDSRGGWPSFGRDAANTGVALDDAGPATDNVHWRTLGDGGSIAGSPTVADGTVYVAGTGDQIHAIDAVSGDHDWRFSTDDYVETAPTVADGRVYAADNEGVIYSLTTAGEEEWRHETDRNLHARSVAVTDDLVYVATAGTMPAVASGDTDESRAGAVVAVSRDTGDEMWRYTGPDDWFTGPALGDGRVYVGNHDGSVVALDAASGDHRWTYTVEAPERGHSGRPLAPPAYADGTVYVSIHGDGTAIALDAGSGDRLWRTPLDAGNVKSSPAVDGDRVYVAAYRISGGEPLGRNPVTGGWGAATRTKKSGRLLALSRTDGEVEWVHERPHDVRSSPAVVGDRIYLGGGDGIFAVTRDAGDEVWSATFEGRVASSPAVTAGRLFVARNQGYLYCIADE